MTHKEILERAIAKAVDGGWNPNSLLVGLAGPYGKTGESGYTHWGWTFGDYDEDLEKLAPILIYNHDFAKALWGQELVKKAHGTLDKYWFNYDGPAWKWHLQQMVIATDPIDYLGKHVDL